MRRLSRWVTVTAVLGLMALAGPLAAQTSSAADDAYEQAMSHWRAATWYSRLGDANIAAIEVDTLFTTWQVVAALPANERPSLYQKDPNWPQTLAAVTTLVVEAAHAADGNDTKATAADLEKIGDDLAAARQRAGTVGFSDAVRRYQATVDRLSGLMSFAAQRQGAPFDDTRRAAVQNATAACAAAATALTTAIPPRWVDDTKLKSLIRQNLDSIKTLQGELAQHGSGLKIAAAINVLRSNYALLFLSYG